MYDLQFHVAGKLLAGREREMPAFRNSKRSKARPNRRVERGLLVAKQLRSELQTGRSIGCGRAQDHHGCLRTARLQESNKDGASSFESKKMWFFIRFTGDPTQQETPSSAQYKHR